MRTSLLLALPVLVKRNPIRLATVCLALALLGGFAGTASAGMVKLGNHSEGDIKKHCDAAGGVFFTNDAGGYGCAGKGGSVSCDKSGCMGECPKCGARMSGGLKGILTPTAAGVASKMGVSGPGPGAKPITPIIPKANFPSAATNSMAREPGLSIQKPGAGPQQLVVPGRKAAPAAKVDVKPISVQKKLDAASPQLLR